MTDLAELPDLGETRFRTIRVVEETGSTNADLLAEAATAPEGTVLVTGHQTAGRGRQRRTWHDDPGNALLVSFLIRPPRRLAPLLPLLAGVAAVEALGTLVAGEGEGPVVGLKWPNDVLAPTLDERKLAGILAESTTVPAPRPGHHGGGDGLAVVVGMGLNLRWGRPPPAEIAARAATVGELIGRDVERDDVLHRHLRAVEYWLRRVEDAGDAQPLLDRYRHHCLTIGRTVRFATSTAEHVGTATGVTDRGTLLLSTEESGTVELHAGDAHHLP